MRKILAIGLSVLAVAVVTGGIAVASKDAGNDNNFKYAIGLWGDLPYSSVQADPGVPNLIADMNNADIEFTVYDGDLKQGNGPPVCSDALYAQALGWFNSLKKPAIVTPGDNDWTDCDRPNNGAFNSLERLDHERQVFFSTDKSLGAKQLKQEVQTAPSCLGYVSGPVLGPSVTKAVPCVENRRWETKDVIYATLNIQGSCNNLCGVGADAAEYAARNAANIAWLHETFAEARAEDAAAVMLISQANPGFDLTGAPFADGVPDAPTRDPKTLDPAGANASNAPGFKDFLVALRSEVTAFRKPVAYVHGDTHYFRIDKPFLAADGQRLENFTRVETFGDNAANGLNDVHWVKALVDPKSRDVFAFQPQMVPANRTAVPAP
jgi:hypothetical protein